MILNLIILIILFVLFILYQSIVTLLFGSGTIFQNTINMFALIAGSLIVFHIFYNMYIYYSLMNSNGFVGPKGIEGLVGQTGKKAQCTSNCGQKVCSKLVLEHMNKYIKDKNLKIAKTINNKFIKNKVNKICHSEKYKGFLYSEKPNKPNEKELIEYIKNKSTFWVDKILENDDGEQFLNTPEIPETFFDGDSPELNPFTFLKKFEIWDWGDPYRFKPIIRRQCGINKNLPKVDSELNVIFTNKYELVYNNTLIDDIWGPEEFCLYNQLGNRRTNPRNIGKCIYDESADITTYETFKEFIFTGYKKDISFYNVDRNYLEDLADKQALIEKQPYYQLGSVWRGTNEVDRNTVSDLVGPPKNTIIVQDNDFRENDPNPNLKKATEFLKIWCNTDHIFEKNNKDINDSNYGIDFLISHDIDKVTIWRPKPPENYVSLGDFVTAGDLDPNDNKNETYFRCIRKDLVTSFEIDNVNVWKNEGYEVKYRKNIDIEIDDSKIIKQATNVSIWPAGVSEKDEEIQNLGFNSLNNVKENGYNYFRTSDSIQYEAPLETSYLISPSNYTVSSKENMKAPNNDYGVGWLGGKLREAEYSTYKAKVKIGFTPEGILKHDSLDEKNNKFNFFITHDEDMQSYFIVKSDNKGFHYLKIKSTEDELEWKNYEEEPINKNTNNIKDDREYYWSIKVLEKISDKNKYNVISITSNYEDSVIKRYLHFDDGDLIIEDNASKWKLFPSTNFDTDDSSHLIMNTKSIEPTTTSISTTNSVLFPTCEPNNNKKK